MNLNKILFSFIGAIIILFIVASIKVMIIKSNGLLFALLGNVILLFVAAYIFILWLYITRKKRIAQNESKEEKEIGGKL